MQRINTQISQISIKDYLKCFQFEMFAWIGGLFLLAISNPLSNEHFTLFLPDLLFDIKSPGYNLGHSIAYLFRGEIINSFDAHPLGIFALIILLYRVFTLGKKTIKNINRLRSSNG